MQWRGGLQRINSAASVLSVKPQTANTGQLPELEFERLAIFIWLSLAAVLKDGMQAGLPNDGCQNSNLERAAEKNHHFSILQTLQRRFDGTA